MRVNAEIAGLIIGAALSSGTPVLYATTGEVLAQRAGIVNLGLEGAMLVGAVSSAWVYYLTQSVPLAVLAGALAGGLLGLVHGSLVSLARIGMLASGICIFFIGRGLSAFYGQQMVGRQLIGLPHVRVPYFSQIPILGDALFSHDVLVYLAIFIACAMWYLLFRTPVGLLVRSVGENTEAAKIQGVPTSTVRIAASTIGASLAGLGGVYIVLGFSHTWLEGVTAGRGWVAIGLVVLARWNPLYAIPIAYLFGGVIAIQLNAQAAGVAISPYLLAMLPYVLTIVALTLSHVWSRGSGIPAELARGRQ